jgi:hypothetical protein
MIADKEKFMLLAYASLFALFCAEGGQLTPFILPDKSKVECSLNPLVIEGVDFCRGSSTMPSITVPKGVVNIAKGKKVSASSQAYGSSLGLVNDGVKEIQPYFFFLENQVEWIQIDLGCSAEIYVIWIWHSYGAVERAEKDVIVELCDSPCFSSKVITVFNNDEDGSAGRGIGSDKPYIEKFYGKPIVLDQPVHCRYVRLYSAGSYTGMSGPRYIEVEVYAKSSEVEGVSAPR